MSSRNTLSRRIRYRIEYALFRPVAGIIMSLSPTTLYRLSGLIAGLLFCVSRKRRRIARINLDIAFGDSKSPDEKDRIIKASMRQMILSALQCIWVSRDTENRVHQLIGMEVEGREYLDQCENGNVGFLVLMAHYGNWEILGLYHGFLNTTQHYAVARRLDNPYLEKFFMDMRLTSGNRILHKDTSLIRIVRAIKEKSSITVLMDQNGGDHALFVDFFGKKAATARSLAALSYSTGAPILPIFSIPIGKGRYKIVYKPPLKLEKTDDKEADIFRWTEQCEKVLEEIIRDYPEPWMWFHRRWKSRPPEERHLPVY
ncbi:lysophospholipid acyltransferase family protein [Nitrospina gracilis]|uniref:lysophospholipid acyltransferase family protein n=1 Tax=Nitrospina gracilis TaxID=35801 RepID=UPI001F19EE43|nr:lysophospholipid acyltransferase family protein [Nitrospina gracilis]MCF8720302.1 KDO2-lipid IV(A) lauroyltransferase [Nitrospina gracilis Nb-211]